MGQIAGGLLQGYSQGKVQREEREFNDKVKKAQLRIAELQIDQAQRQQSARQKLTQQFNAPPPPLNPQTGMQAAPMQNAGQPAPKAQNISEMLASMSLPDLMDFEIDPVQIMKIQAIANKAQQPKVTNNMADFAQANTNPSYAAYLEKMRAAQQQPGVNFTYGQDAQGNTVAIQPTATGPKIYPLPSGTNVTPLMAFDPQTLFNKNQASASGKAQGAAQGEALATLPATIAKSEYTINLLSALINHPGMSDVVGVPNPLTVLTPGTDAADFKSMLGQVQGQQFLEAYNELKGGGSITEAEGTKAETAKARMQTSQSEKSFIAAATEFQAIIQKGIERAKKKASSAATNSAQLSIPASTEISSQAEYDALPSGAIYTGPDGKQRRKP
jgi:hypothetical protein